MSLRIVTWNVNSLRSALGKGFLEWLEGTRPDIVCLQEVRAELKHLYPLEQLFKGYVSIWNPAERPGYAGTAILSRFKPVHIERGLIGQADPQGRSLTVDFGDFIVGSYYAPNATPGTEKIPIKCAWLQAFREHILQYADKPFIIGGDLNVAYTEHDSQGVRNPSYMNGCTPEERRAFQSVFDTCQLHDALRAVSRDKILSTWWPTSDFIRHPAEGMRYDYVLTQSRYAGLVRGHAIDSDVRGSDHCPVSLVLELPTNSLQRAETAGQSQLL